MFSKRCLLQRYQKASIWGKGLSCFQQFQLYWNFFGKLPFLRKSTLSNAYAVEEYWIYIMWQKTHKVFNSIQWINPHSEIFSTFLQRCFLDHIYACSNMITLPRNAIQGHLGPLVLHFWKMWEKEILFIPDIHQICSRQLGKHTCKNMKIPINDKVW